MSLEAVVDNRGPQVGIALGSNIAPELNLPAAMQLLARRCTILNSSQVWMSAPIGDSRQADFCNAALLVSTDLPPRELKYDVLRDIEKQLGRVRDPLNKNAARTIDLDIAFFGSVRLNEPDLTIPDPELHLRPFLLVPLWEVAPNWIHPVLHRSLEELLTPAAFAGLTQRPDIGLKNLT